MVYVKYWDIVFFVIDFIEIESYRGALHLGVEFRTVVSSLLVRTYRRVKSPSTKPIATPFLLSRSEAYLPFLRYLLSICVLEANTYAQDRLLLK